MLLVTGLATVTAGGGGAVSVAGLHPVAMPIATIANGVAIARCRRILIDLTIPGAAPAVPDLPGREAPAPAAAKGRATARCPSSFGAPSPPASRQARSRCPRGSAIRLPALDRRRSDP